VKKIAIIPTLFTLGNAVCGFASIALASKIDGGAASKAYFAYGAAFIFRRWCSTGSTATWPGSPKRRVSWRSARQFVRCDQLRRRPAFLLLRLGQDWEATAVRQTIAIIAALYMMCAVLRLARFNVENSPDL